MKWRKSVVGVAAVDELAQRLRAATPNVMGVLVSANGFARSAIKRVEENATRPMLLVNGDELRHIEHSRGFYRLLREKYERLTVQRRAIAATNAPGRTGPAGPLPAGGQYAFLVDGVDRQSMRELAGGFSRVGFCLELPDLDWSDGCGVSLELSLADSDTPGLLEVFQRLGERGWTTMAGVWRLQQQSTTWNGFGADALRSAMHEPARRYAGRQMHHSETLTYVDAAGGGLYALTATVSRTEVDHVSRPTLSFRLPGVPFDPGPLQTLARSLDLNLEPHFRPLSTQVTSRFRVPLELRRRPLQPEALIVGNPALTISGDDETGAEEEWVLGAVVKNPFAGWRPRQGGSQLSDADEQTLAELGRDNDFLVCALGSWHLSSERRQYVVEAIETAPVGDALLTRVTLNWHEARSSPWPERRPTARGVRQPRVGMAPKVFGPAGLRLPARRVLDWIGRPVVRRCPD